MAVSEVLMDVKAYAMLNNGSTTSGSIKTIAQSIGLLDKSKWDAEKVMLITQAAGRVFDKQIYYVKGSKDFALEND